MQILLRQAGKTPPAPGQPGIFALGMPGLLDRLLVDSGFVGIEQRTVAVPLRLPSAAQALATMQEACGAYRAIISGSLEAVRVAAWTEVAETLKIFETPMGFVAPAEALAAAGAKSARGALGRGAQRATALAGEGYFI